MKISATSALVLNWTASGIYTGPKVLSYLNSLDLSEGNEMLSRFKEDQHYMHTQTVSGRKFYMLQSSKKWLSRFEAKGNDLQVINPGAGIAPYSAAIAELFPSAKLWDIDLYSMEEKALQLKKTGYGNIQCITCDLNQIENWTKQLIETGYMPDQPGIMILEGITYYLSTATLKAIFSWAKQHQIHVMGDWGLPFEIVTEAHRKYPIGVFGTIGEMTQHPGIHFYDRETFRSLLQEAGFEKIDFTPITNVQLERTGDTVPFTEPNSCWIEIFEGEA